MKASSSLTPPLPQDREFGIRDLGWSKELQCLVDA
jgi:hypothetical protein